MSEYLLDVKHLLTESDVEMKLVLPLLTNPIPVGLNYDSTNLQTKTSLRKLVIGKGDKSQLYFPDFVLNIRGVPVAVVEVKKPGENLEEAFRQAALYAGEINKLFPSKQNPCELIIACNGQEIAVGMWDSETPTHIISVANWLPTSVDFSAFIKLASRTTLEKHAENFRKSLRTEAAFKNPLLLIGGKHIQNQRVQNSFGEALSIQYRHLFNPNEENERKDIVRNAYVQVSKHDSHVQPIDRLIRKKIRPSFEQSTEIEDQETPVEIIDKLQNAHSYNNQVLLLIGSVGSGKSTFTTYLREVALEAAVVHHTFWLTLDLNDAPVTASEIYKWLKVNLIDQIKMSDASIDYDEIEFIEQLYSKQISALRKGALSKLNPTSDKYKEILVSKILEFQADIDLTLKSYINTFVHEKGKELVIVLDNCDKRNLDEQLLMFDVANYIKDNVKAIVFLPLRDTTFDHFRNEKPLDTVIKDLIFRINPPSLEKVIYSRVKYAIRLSEKSKSKYYVLPNGFTVNIPTADELSYFKSILKSLFQSSFFKRLIAGLAGRDVRRGIEIFLDFCKSGHISDREIFKMKQTKGEFRLANHIISRVFLRGSRLYYSDSDSRIKNIFHSEPSDDLPDPFIRISILKWLNDRHRIKGPSGIIGFHRTEDLIAAMSRFGHAVQRVEEELLFLIRNVLVASESQDTTKISRDDLISINPPGIIHMELTRNVDYLSSCAEDFWFKTVAQAEDIAKDLGSLGQYSHLSFQNNLKHAKMLVQYLQDYYNNNFGFHEGLLAESETSMPLNFAEILKEIIEFEDNGLHEDKLELEPGSQHKATIVNVKEYGLICEIEGSEFAGLLHHSDLPLDFDEIYKLGDRLEVLIKEFKPDHKKYNLLLKDEDDITSEI